MMVLLKGKRQRCPNIWTMKTKTLNFENGISYYLTSSAKSYTELANDLTEKMRDLNNDTDITSQRVKEWAYGTLPQGTELDAITALKYDGDITRWKDLFFPSTEFTLKFIKHITKTQVKKVLDASQISNFIDQRSLATLYKGMDSKDVTLNTLASILIMKSYFKLCQNDLISDTQEKDYSFEHYRQIIMPYLEKELNSLSFKSVFVQNAMNSLKNTLTKDSTNRANIRREALRQVISII